MCMSLSVLCKHALMLQSHLQWFNVYGVMVLRCASSLNQKRKFRPTNASTCVGCIETVTFPLFAARCAIFPHAAFTFLIRYQYSIALANVGLTMCMIVACCGLVSSLFIQVYSTHSMSFLSYSRLVLRAN